MLKGQCVTALLEYLNLKCQHLVVSTVELLSPTFIVNGLHFSVLSNSPQPIECK